jgi:8-oxo-dGTP pyrophosphatase MutT (NUDIX family)
MDVLHNARNLAIIRLLRERLAPVDRADTLVDAVEGPRPQARLAAVLLPLFVQDGALSLAFIRRSSSLRSHSGEIAFPGGKVDSGERFPVETALREAHEEIGLAPERVEVLGLLSPVFTVVSNFLIFPVVAFLPHGLGALSLQPAEVTELILAPLEALADPSIAYTEQWSRGDMTRTVYFYPYGSHLIWGATGRILSHLLRTLSPLDQELC